MYCIVLPDLRRVTRFEDPAPYRIGPLFTTPSTASDLCMHQRKEVEARIVLNVIHPNTVAAQGSALIPRVLLLMRYMSSSPSGRITQVSVACGYAIQER